MGKEHVRKRVNTALGLILNIGRVAQGGRSWEGFGADPFLVSVAAHETILGMQSAGLQTRAKHYINENKRTSVLRKASLLSYACEDNNTLNGILKDELGFQRFVVSDWSARHSTISATTGQDITMPSDITFDTGTSYVGANFTAHVRKRTIPEARVDDVATRIPAWWYLRCQDSSEFPKTNFYAFLPLDEGTNEHRCSGQSRKAGPGDRHCEHRVSKECEQRTPASEAS
ncbi:glycoside hydrolase superfamily [Russula brevipes]|nr:glycoside hydrolase superfamily [Russula brevipes]